jgi:hypothetical protein
MVLFYGFSLMPILNIAGILKIFFLHFVGRVIWGGYFSTVYTPDGDWQGPGLRL